MRDFLNVTKVKTLIFIVQWAYKLRLSALDVYERENCCKAKAFFLEINIFLLIDHLLASVERFNVSRMRDFLGILYYFSLHMLSMYYTFLRCIRHFPMYYNLLDNLNISVL